jgi:hypothetical protein
MADPNGVSVVTLANTTSSGTGTVSPSGSSTVTLASTTSSAVGASAYVGVSTVTIADTTSAGVGAAAYVGTSTVTLANTTSAATGAVQITGTSVRTFTGMFVNADTDAQGFITENPVVIADLNRHRLVIPPVPQFDDSKLMAFLEAQRKATMDAYNRLSATATALGVDLGLTLDRTNDVASDITIISGGVNPIDFTPFASLPPGGLDGQILTKQSTAEGDADWEDPNRDLEIPFSYFGEIYRNSTSPRWPVPYAITLTGMRARLSTARDIVLYLSNSTGLNLPSLGNEFDSTSQLNTWTFSQNIPAGGYVSLFVDGQGSAGVDLGANNLTVVVTYRRT